jgi:uncharacterized protein YbaR (Trm112 family)
LGEDAEDEYFGLEEKEEEQSKFEMVDGGRLEAEIKVREEATEEERRIVEPEERQWIPVVNEIPEIHLEGEANAVEEVRRNEKK